MIDILYNSAIWIGDMLNFFGWVFIVAYGMEFVKYLFDRFFDIHPEKWSDSWFLNILYLVIAGFITYAYVIFTGIYFPKFLG